MEPLIAPCLCRGSVRHLHASCLLLWLNHNSQASCELCHYPYVFVRRRSPLWKWPLKLLKSLLPAPTFGGLLIAMLLLYICVLAAACFVIVPKSLPPLIPVLRACGAALLLLQAVPVTRFCLHLVRRCSKELLTDVEFVPSATNSGPQAKG